MQWNSWIVFLSGAKGVRGVKWENLAPAEATEHFRVRCHRRHYRPFGLRAARDVNVIIVKKHKNEEEEEESLRDPVSLSLHFIYRCNINITCVLYIYIYNTCRYVPRSLWLISVSLWCVGDWLTSTAKGKPLRNTQGHGGGGYIHVLKQCWLIVFFSLFLFFLGKRGQNGGLFCLTHTHREQQKRSR